MQKKILVVDNNPVIVTLMENFLLAQGHEVRSASCGLEGLGVLSTYTPDIMFVDLIMPNIDGRKFCEVVRNNPSFDHIVIVILSGVAAEEDIRVSEFGADYCIAKGPFAKISPYILDTLERTRPTQNDPSEKDPGIMGLEHIYRREVTNELLVSQGHLLLILENMSEAVVEFNEDNKIVDANLAALSLIHKKKEEILSGDFLDIFNEIDRESIKGIISKAKQDVKIKKLENYIKVNNHHIFLSILPVLDEYRTFFIAVAQDVTDLVKKESELEDALEREKKAGKSKSAFVANMSHEIRTPMNAILGMTNLALQAELPPKVNEYLSIIKSSSNILLGIINDILDFSKIESGRLDIETIKFNLHDILTNLLAMFQIKAREKGVEFILDVEDDVPDALLGDQLHLGQVLVNLIGNAIKFTEKGSVSLKIRNESPSGGRAQILFSVCDTGIGIVPGKVKTIFDTFSQAEKSTSRNFGGSGLGLTISKKLVELMGGEITVDSTPGKGSTFSFSIPFAVQVREPEIFSEVYTNKKILVVDDEVSILSMLEEILPTVGFDIDTATLPSVAMRKLHEHQEQGVPFDLVIMDYIMPEQDGFITAKMIRNDPKLAETPIIMQTGFFGKELSEQRAKQAGIDAILFKPVGIKLLIENIKNIFEKKESAQKSALPPQNDSIAKLQGLKVLLAEDNVFNQMLAREILEQAGITLELATNGKEAVEMASTQLSAILMDVEMPEMDGFEATRQIRQQPQFQKIPIIAMTAHALSGYREKCLEAGMDDYMTKPFQPEEIFSILARNISSSTENPI